jgi:hypothetical protein
VRLGELHSQSNAENAKWLRKHKKFKLKNTLVVDVLQPVCGMDLAVKHNRKHAGMQVELKDEQ